MSKGLFLLASHDERCATLSPTVVTDSLPTPGRVCHIKVDSEREKH